MKKKRRHKDVEARLAKAYDAGFFDGYHQGSDEVYRLWLGELPRVKGIGRKTYYKIVNHITEALLRIQEERGLTKNPMSKEVEELELRTGKDSS